MMHGLTQSASERFREIPEVSTCFCWQDMHRDVSYADASRRPSAALVATGSTAFLLCEAYAGSRRKGGGHD